VKNSASIRSKKSHSPPTRTSWVSRRLKLAFVLPALFLLLSGCAVSTTDTIAVLPALKTGSAEQTVNDGVMLPTTVAVLPFANNSQSEFAFSVVRRTLFNHFASKNYRMLHWQDVDNRLQLAGITSQAQLLAKSPAEIMAVLGVDGLVYGTITHYDKTFVGVYSQVAVGVELQFLNGAGATIWEVKDVRRSHAGGASLSPVGLIMNALVAAEHIYGDLNLYRAADDLGRDLAKDMPEPANLTQRTRPLISNVVHSGVNQYLKYGDKLEIGVEGAPGMQAVASIDGLGVIDLTEQAPGQYVGSVIISKDLNVTDVVVTGKLQDSFGQTSSWISPYGLLTIDNTAPGAVMGLVAEARDGAIYLDWQAPAADDIKVYQVSSARSETGIADKTWQAANSDFEISGATNFEPRYVAVRAIDRAGNVGPAQRLAAVAAPDSRYGKAMSLGTALPPVINGIYKMEALNNPYYLRNNSRIATDGVLLIAPGVEILVSPRTILTVQGELHIFGSSDNLVRVDDIADQGFDSFLALQSNLAVTIHGLSITGAGTAIKISAGSPLIADSILAESQFSAIDISGVARPVIRTTQISGAKTSGVSVSGQAQPVFKNNRFIDNEPFQLQNGSTYQVDATENQWQPAASNMTILGDVIY
jgi:hypothetical protein